MRVYIEGGCVHDWDYTSTRGYLLKKNENTTQKEMDVNVMRAREESERNTQLANWWE